MTGKGFITLEKVRSLFKSSDDISEIVKYPFSSEDRTFAMALVAQDMKRSLFWSIWREDAKNGTLLNGGDTISSMKLLGAIGKSTDVILSHDWGEHGNNHQKIKLLGEALMSKGLNLFDNDL